MSLNWASCLGNSSALATRLVFAAARTNTRSPHTTGVELPGPGSSVFHLMLVAASQFSGGSAFGAVPLASGPRQWCQLAYFSASKSAAAAPASARDRAHAASERVMV